MATFNLFMTRRAKRTFGWPEPQLIEAYQAFDPSAPLGDIKTILQYSDIGGGQYPHFHVGDGKQRRYIRVVTDIAEGSRSADAKRDLMTRVHEALTEYEGKHAGECDMEIRINEVKAEDVLIIRRSEA